MFGTQLFNTFKFPKKKKKNTEVVFDDLENNLLSDSGEWKLEDFRLLETLGTGTFGRVLLACHKDTLQYFAMKVLKKNKVIQLKQVQHVMDERKVQGIIKCPFTVQLHKTFQDRNKLYMILDYACGGELFTWLRKNKRFSEKTAKFFACEILLAIEYMHSKGVIFRDLKPENVLIDESGHVKLADFGFAKIVKDKTWTMCGTPEYLAPEVILGTGHDKAVDYWAFGVLLYEMLAGYPPFYGRESQMEIYTKIVSGKYAFPSFISKTAKDLIKKLLAKNKMKRLGNLKDGVADIKAHKFFDGVNWEKVVKKKTVSPININLDCAGSSKYFLRYKESLGIPEVPPSKEENELFKDF